MAKQKCAPIDKSFLDKFRVGETYCLDYNEYVSSIFAEIHNILSCRLKIPGEVLDHPFNYGITDLSEIDSSGIGLEKFKARCRETILYYEKRIADLDITDIKINNNDQTLQFSINCMLKKTGCKVNKNIKCDLR